MTPKSHSETIPVFYSNDFFTWVAGFLIHTYRGKIGVIIIIIYCLQDIKLTCANFHNIPIYVTQLMAPCIGSMKPARIVCQESLLGAHHLGNIVPTNV